MRSKKETVSDGIRKAIDNSGVSRYALAKAAGVEQATLSRFMRGKAAITTTTLDALAKVLGLRIVAEGPVKTLAPGKRGRPPKRKEGR